MEQVILKQIENKTDVKTNRQFLYNLKNALLLSLLESDILNTVQYELALNELNKHYFDLQRIENEKCD